MHEPKLHELIKLNRNRLGITQATLAKILGVHRITVTRWESGALIPGSEMIDSIAETLGIDGFKKQRLRVALHSAKQDLPQKSGGLASPSKDEHPLVVLDPATGSATYGTSFARPVVLEIVQLIEEVLANMKRTMPPRAKAQLVVDLCALASEDAKGEGLLMGKVIPLLMQRLG